jgi:hypothetical protein
MHDVVRLKWISEVPEAKYVKYFNPNHIIAMGGSKCTGGCKSDLFRFFGFLVPKDLFGFK